ncbi:nuclear transport factor 2 family protein [Chitinimonas sp.]|uniref:YybH family protein n=1 Tax=Chitinimonas sp. TaxID=1934313 RepID=UPI0035B15E02
MRNPRILMAGLAAVVAFTVDAATPTETVEQFHAAMQRGDQAAVETLLLPELLIYESGWVERSRAEYAGHHLPEDIAYAKTSKTRVLKQQATEAGDAAVVMSETETSASKGKVTTRYAGTETMVLRRVDSDWRIAHVHWSSRKLKP